MRCLFCKKDSEDSKSVEHIIPESLGNSTLTLRAGIICDQCNNYFARKVEGPFLNHPSMVTLRHYQVLPNKRGLVPPLSGWVGNRGPAVMRYDPQTDFRDIEVSEATLRSMQKAGSGRIYFPIKVPVPNDIILSRFLAKMALECMAKRLEDQADGLDYLVDEEQLDPLREHARLGKNPVWPINARTLYDANAKQFDETGRALQLLHESDLLVTEWGEWYFVIAIFGEEYAINLGGPDIEGYRRWLAEHDDASPLYYGKNSDFTMPS